MTDIVVLHKFPGGKPGQILPLDERTQRQVDAGNAKILPAGQKSQPEAEQTHDVARMRGTGSLSLVQDDDASDYDELTGPGEKGPEGLTDAELEQLTAPDADGEDD